MESENYTAGQEKLTIEDHFNVKDCVETQVLEEGGQPGTLEVWEVDAATKRH